MFNPATLPRSERKTGEALLNAAIHFAVKAHEDQTDRQKMPYILHPLAVMEKVKHLGYEHMVVAVLHDVVEDNEFVVLTYRADGDYTLLESLAAPVGLRLPGVIGEALEAITQRGHVENGVEVGETHEAYLARLIKNPIAVRVKVADAEHNLSRVDGLKPETRERLSKKLKHTLAVVEAAELQLIAEGR